LWLEFVNDLVRLEGFDILVWELYVIAGMLWGLVVIWWYMYMWVIICV
jgi:hypothetical protein